MCKIIWASITNPNTCHKAHIHRVVLSARAPVAQLAVAVAPPALDAAPAYYHACVALAQGDGEGSVT